MKTSARNHFPGIITEIIKGPVSTEVAITIAPGVDVVATISTRSADSLGLVLHKPVHALIKASSVIIAIG